MKNYCTIIVLFTQETFRLLTPGGGGFGQATETSQAPEKPGSEVKTFVERGSVYEYRQAQESA